MLRHSVSWNKMILEAIESRLSPDLAVVAAERPNLWADLVARKLFALPVIRTVIDLPPVAELIPQPLPTSQVQRTLDARIGNAWSKYLGERGTMTTLNHIHRVTRAVRHLVPTIALWPEWIPTGAKLHGFRKAFGFMPNPVAQKGSVLPAVRLGGHLVFVAGTEGTTSGWLKQFTGTSAAVCRESGLSGILIGGKGTPDESDPDSGFVSIGFCPLNKVLAGAAALIHHGGIGTAAAAIESGVPQIAIPRIFMQPMNSEWMRRLGVCTVIHPREWTADNATRSVKALLSNHEMKNRVAELATRIDRPAALSATCSFLEERANYR
jgi:rhamnosyltransferase subunit B